MAPRTTTATIDDEDLEAPRKSSKAAETWSPALAAGGWTSVPRALLRFYPRLQLTATEFIFILNVVEMKRDKAVAFPSFRTLAERLGADDRWVRRVARSLEKKGLMSIEERRRPGDRSGTNLFGIAPLVQKLEELQSSEADSSSKTRKKPA